MFYQQLQKIFRLTKCLQNYTVFESFEFFGLKYPKFPNFAIRIQDDKVAKKSHASIAIALDQV